MVGAAKRRLSTAVEQLDSARADYQATQAAAQQAEDSALLAQSNAAQAAQKATSGFGQSDGDHAIHYHH